MEQNHYDVIVIGAGPGGSTIAGLLASRGKRVLVIDKNSGAGGKMTAFHKYGHTYEMFPLNMMPFAPSLFETLARETGKTDEIRNVAAEFKGDDKAYIIYKNRDGKLKWFNSSKPTSIMKVDLSLLDMPKVVKVFKHLFTMDDNELNSLNRISAYDYMKSLNLPESIFVLITASMGEGAFEMSSDMVPASQMIRMLRLGLSPKHKTQRYYEGGIGGFFDTILKTVTENGGSLVWKQRVKRVLVKDNKAVGVETDGGELYYAPLIISNAGIRQTVCGLVESSVFDEEYFNKIKNLQSNLADIGYRYFTSKPVLKKSTYVYFPYNCLEPWSAFEMMKDGQRKPKSNYIYIGTKSVYPTVSPEGKQLIFAVMSCHPDPDQDFSPYLEYIENCLRELFPLLFEEGVIEHREVMTLKSVHELGAEKIFDGQGGESYGIANSIGQADNDMPKCKTQLEGLYIVGNDAEGFGVGCHRAVDSGFKLFNHLVEDGLVKSQLLRDELISQ